MTLEEVKARLEMLGYTATNADDNIINFLITKTTSDIKVKANITEIPTDYNNQVTDIIVGEFLQNKKAVGADLGNINLGLVAKSMDIGDTKIDFGKENKDAEFDRLILTMINANYSSIISSLRCFKW